MGTIARIGSSEEYDRIGIVERSHGNLRTVYDKLCIGLSRIGKHERFSMVLKVIYYSPPSENGIAPTTLAYRVYPKIPGDAGRGSIKKKSNINRDCTEIVAEMKVRRALCATMVLRN